MVKNSSTHKYHVRSNILCELPIPGLPKTLNPSKTSRNPEDCSSKDKKQPQSKPTCDGPMCSSTLAGGPRSPSKKENAIGNNEALQYNTIIYLGKYLLVGGGGGINN